MSKEKMIVPRIHSVRRCHAIAIGGNSSALAFVRAYHLISKDMWRLDVAHFLKVILSEDEGSESSISVVNSDNGRSESSASVLG